VVYVLDTSVILTYSGSLGAFLEKGMATTPSVVDEIGKEPQRSMVERLRYAGLQIISPPVEAIRRVREIATELGEAHLSKTDMEVLALALHLNACLLTEDYSMLNVAEALGLCWKSLTTRGIKRVYQWGFRCVSCGRVYESSPGEVCPICGGELRRWRLSRKRKVNLKC
ncbi:MAG: hypothetical protein J7L88_01400, partial [Thermoplasmata archaeon]|nr:hypothetical protein [Thermoplasmata archaeon]